MEESIDDLFEEEKEQIPVSLQEMPIVDDSLVLRAFIVRNPLVFNMRKVRDLFTRAFPIENALIPNPIDAIGWCAGTCEKATTAIIIAVEGDPMKDGQFRGLLIGDYDPENAWSTSPWILHFYSTGAPVVRTLADALVLWLKEIGHSQFYGFNRSGASDDAYARFLSSHFDSERVSSLLKLTVKEPE